MEIEYGPGKTQYGPGVDIHLTGNEVALAIHAWLTGQGVFITGACTVTVNGQMVQTGRVYVDPSADVIASGERYCGRGPGGN